MKYLLIVILLVGCRGKEPEDKFDTLKGCQEEYFAMEQEYMRMYHVADSLDNLVVKLQAEIVYMKLDSATWVKSGTRNIKHFTPNVIVDTAK